MNEIRDDGTPRQGENVAKTGSVAVNPGTAGHGTPLDFNRMANSMKDAENNSDVDKTRQYLEGQIQKERSAESKNSSGAKVESNVASKTANNNPEDKSKEFKASR